MDILRKPPMKVVELAFTYKELNNLDFRANLRKMMTNAEVDQDTVVAFRLKNKAPYFKVGSITMDIRREVIALTNEFKICFSRIIINGYE